MQDAGQEAEPADANRGKGLYRAVFNMKIIHLFAVWALVYVGAEVTLGGARCAAGRAEMLTGVQAGW